jgi:hypothetical protein
MTSDFVTVNADFFEYLKLLNIEVLEDLNIM